MADNQKQHFPFCTIPLSKNVVVTDDNAVLDEIELVLVHGKHVDAETMPWDRPNFGELHGLPDHLTMGLLNGVIDLYRLGPIHGASKYSFDPALRQLQMKNLDYDRYCYNPYRAVEQTPRRPSMTFTLAAEFCGDVEYYRELFGKREWQQDWEQ